jgi:hypothetical protein
MPKKKTKLDKMSKKEKTSLAYALATNLAKHGKPQTPKEGLTKGQMKKREKNVKKFKKAFDLEETIKNALKNPKKADLNKDGKLSSYEETRGAAIEKAMAKEHHIGDPNAKYVAVYGGKGWYDVWEGEPFADAREHGVLVGKFTSLKDAKDYANSKNAEQGKLEEKKDYLKEDTNKIIALEKERERLMADMEQEAEPGGGPIADEYGAKLDRIDKALEKLKGTQKQYKVLSTAELNKLARIKR